MEISKNDPILKSPIMGFAHHRIILDDHGKAVDYEFLEVNPTFEALTGLKREKIIGKTVRQAIPGIGNSEFNWIGFYGDIALNTAEKEFEQYSEPLKKWYRVHAYSTEKLFFTTMFIDISASKQKEEELRYKSTILENIHDSVVATDTQFRITYINKSAEKLYGYTQEELLGKSPDIFNAEPMSQKIQQELYDVVSSGNIYENISINRRKDGSLFYCDYKIQPITNNSGKITSFVGVQRDITTSKKQTEELEAFFSVNLDLLCIADLEGNFIKTNRAWSNLLGYSTEELNQRKFLEFVHPDDIDATLSAMADLGKGEKVLEFINRYRSKDGSYRFIEWRSHPKGNLIYAAARDVTDKIDQERKLNDTNRMLQTILDTIPQHVFWKDRNSVYLGCNTRGAKVAGLTHPSEIVGKTDYDLAWKKEESDFFRECDQRVMNSGKPELHIIEPQKQADGKEALLDTTKVPLKGIDGNVYGILVAFEDITEQKEKEKEQLKQAGLINSLLDSTPDIIFFKDTDGVYLGCNQPFSDFVGKSKDEITGKTDYDLFDKEIADFFRYHDKKMMTTLSPRHNEEWITYPDGKKILIDTLKTPFRDSNGDLIGILGISRDITDRKSREDEQKAILETCNDGFFMADSTGRILEVNSAFCTMLGYTKEELCTLKIPDIEGVEKPEDVARRIEKLKREEFDRFESKNRLKDGSLIDVEVSVSMMHDYDGKMVVFVRDITDRKRAERKLVENEQRLKKYVEYAPYGIFVADALGNYKMVNQIACIMTGYTSDELLSMSATGLVYEEDRKSAFEHFKKVQIEGYAESEMRYVRKGGEVRYKKIVAVKLSDNEFLGFNEDITEKIIAQEKIFETNNRLKLAQQVGNVGSWEHNFITNLVTWSEHTFAIYEQDPSTFAVNFENIIAHFHVDDREAVIQALNKSIKERKDLRIEHRIVTGKGNVRHVLETGRIILDNKGEAVKIVGSVADISEQKKSEEALRNSEKTLKTYIEASPLGIFVADFNGKYLDVNKAGEELTGYSREELLSLSIIDILAPEQIKEGLAIAREVIESGTGEGICLAQRKDGTPFWLWIVASKVNNEYLLAFCQDISDRKQAEEKLLQSEQNQKILLDNIQTQIWYLKDETTYGAINKAHADFNGVKIEDLAFKDLYEIFPEDIVNVCKKSNTEVFRTKKTVRTEEWVPHVSGEKRLISIVKTPKLDSKGNVDYVVCSAEDITARKEAELQLEKNLSFQKTVADISSRFVKTTKVTLDKDMDNMLMQIGKHFQVDRSYLFTFSANLDKMTNTHEWCSENVPPQMGNIQNQPTRLLPWFMKKIKSRHIVHIKDVEALPVEATAERNEFMSQSIKSLISIAVKTTDKLWGFVGFDAVRTSYSWSENEIDNLIVLANIIGELFLKLENERFLIEARELAETREREVREHKTRLDMILSNTPAVIYTYTINPDGTPTLTYINDNVKNILGYTPDKFMKNIEFWIGCVHPEDLPKLQEKLSGENITNEYRFRDKSGNYHWLLDNQKTLKKDQNCTEIIGTWWDITCQKEAELELNRSKNQLDMFFDQSFSGFFFMMLDEPVDWKNSKDKEALLDYIMSHQRMTKVNQAILDQYGAKEEDFLGLTPNDLFAHDLEHGRYIWKGLFEKGRWHVETEEQKMDGTPIIVDGDYILLYDEQGRITGHFGVQLDITAQKQAQKAVIESELRFAVAIEGSEAGIWDWDMVKNRVVFSTQWKAMLGYTDKEVENTFNGWKNLWHPDDVASIEKSVADHLNGLTKKYEIVHRCRHKNGKWRWLLTRGKILRDQTGTPYRWIGTNIDITKQKNAEEEMKKAKMQAETASKAKSEFLANMSHEIRTPLNGVIGFTNLLLSTPLNNTQKQYVENANISAHSLLGIINDILDFSKIEAGKLELDPVKTDVIELVENSSDIIKYQASQKGLELLMNIEPDIPRYALVDPVRLKQILVNLLSNAVKFTEKGEVELKISFSKIDSKKGKYRFSVRDTGIGISEEQRSRLFKAFSQADTSTTRKYGGTGLGLIIGNMLAEKMGSKIELESEAGKGTNFYFSIITEYKIGEKQDATGLEKIKKVLVVDDNQNNRMILAHNFKHWNISCVCVEDATTALKTIDNSEPFDVIIVDYLMPYIDGLELIKMIRTKLNIDHMKLPTILLYSSVDDAVVNKECKELGVLFKLVKPVKALELYNMLQNVHLKTPQIDKPERVTTIKENKKLTAKSKESEKPVILIAEDVKLNMTLIKILLRKFIADIEIIEAVNGKEAVEKVRENPDINLVLMDIQMPEMDGLEATETIRKDERYKGIPIIALTAGATKTEKKKCEDAGMEDFLVKPVEDDKLYAVLKKYLEIIV